MSFKHFLTCLLTGLVPIIMAVSAFPMGARPDRDHSTIGKECSAGEVESNMSIQEMGKLFWPDSKATRIQQEEALKNILGKRVTWEILVAQIERDESGYIIQGQSDKSMIGTFCYVNPTSEIEKNTILNASMGTKLKVSGVVQDMQMRHIVLKPAIILVSGEQQ